MEKGFIFSLIIALVVGVFAISNGERVEIDLIFTEIMISQAIVIFISTFLGAIIVALISWVKSWRYEKELKELNRRIGLADEEKAKIINEKDQIEKKLNLENDGLKKEIAQLNNTINDILDANNMKHSDKDRGLDIN